MAELKTRPTGASVHAFIAALDEERRRDCETLLGLMREATGAEPKMWGSGIVGFGDHHYVYASGREGDWFTIGFAPRKQGLTRYAMSGFQRYPPLLGKLGKHKLGKGCLYLTRLKNVDLPVLGELIARAARDSRPGRPSEGKS